jgi:Flp pilus assembly protein CpaB
MLATRQGALILAVLCAACAAGILVIALSSYKQSVQVTTKQATVLIATGEIAKGTSGAVIAAEKLYKATPIVASQLTPDAISDAAELNGKIAQADILPGQQLSLTDFGTTAIPTSILTPNQRALSVPADEIHTDLALLQPGDRVDLYEEFKQSTPEVGLMIPNVLVLKTPSSGLAGAASDAASNTSGGSSGGSSSSSGSLILAVNSSQVPSVALTADNGQLWVALRPANATKSVGGILTIAQLMAQATALGPTPSIVSPSDGSHNSKSGEGGHS